METAEQCWQRGEAARVAGDVAAAVAGYRRTLSLVPDFLAGWANLSLVTHRQAPLARAIALDPSHPQLRFNLGNLVQAPRPFRQALALMPAWPEAWLNLGVLVHAEGKLSAAAHRAMRVLALRPAYAEAFNNLGNARRDQGRIADAVAAYGQALGLRPDYADAERNLICARLYRDDDDEASGQAMRAFMRRHGPKTPVPPPPTDRTPHALRIGDPMLRIGLLSSDLGDHPVGRNMQAFVGRRDRRKTFLAVYDAGARGDPMRDAMRGAVDLWREVASLDDERIAAAIRADRIDVLVSLAGRFDRNRPLVAAYRPAPVIAAMHDGGPSGLGLPWITDRSLHPTGDSSGGDPLVRLPVFYSFPKPDRAPPPHRREDGALHLGSFSNPAKLSEPTLACWGRILAHAPETRLHLKYRAWYGDAEVQRRVTAGLMAAGARAEQIVLLAAAEDAEAHLERYGRVDLALDPFPFSGATTTFEALAMGVPVLSLAGRAAIGRTSAAILSALGLEELVASSEADYAQKALALLNDRARLAALRLDIPESLARSALLDAPAYAAQLEQVLHDLWQRHASLG